MKTLVENEIILWLLEGDVSIQFQVYHDLLDSKRDDLRDRISKEGWCARLLSLRNKKCSLQSNHKGKTHFEMEK